MPDEVPIEKLRRTCDPQMLGCQTTAELKPIEGLIGQDRACRALEFGLAIKEHGFNVFVAGLPGTGRTTAVRAYLEEAARKKPVPPDLCYVNNFSDPYRPKALRLPPGRGSELQRDVKRLIEGARRDLPKAFESDEYNARRQQIVDSLKKQRDAAFAQLNQLAQAQGFALQSTPSGLLIIPMMQDKPLSEEEFMALAPSVKEEIMAKRAKVEAAIEEATKQLLESERAINEQLQKFDKEVALYAVGRLLQETMAKYKDTPDVVAYLNALQDDIVANIGLFRGQSETQSPIPGVDTLFREMTFRRYQVNVLVDNSSLQGAPVVMELNPTYLNLFGRIEREAQFGAMVTDFTLIKGGSLHRANGGYLVLHAEEVLSNPFSWDSLKRAIRDRSISIEDVGERLGFVPTKGVMPEAVPLDIKIVLVGTPLTYRLLYGLDEEFNELFKVKADFDSVMDRSGENVRAYAAFIATMVQKENLHQFDSGAVAKVIEHSSRLVEDQEKLSTRFADIADLVREASFWASQDKAAVVTEAHVRRAIEERIYRSNLVQERQRELIERGTLLIDVQGQAIGQVNGLTVIDLGDFAFGRPVRITASLGLGRDGVVDIQREAQLSGKIHTKGVMILGGYLTEKYAHDKPLTLSSRLVFEQSYEEVEGDSASSAELYAILSQLSGLPIQQGLAVTGSVNQKGEVQAIGGVNEKIEGFFEACRIKGLTDKQGVLIPASNVSNLMLKEEVIAAVGQSQFHIYPVRTIDDGIAILTGTPAGERGADGEFPESTVNARVNQKLRELAEGMKEFPKKEEERDEQD